MLCIRKGNDEDRGRKMKNEKCYEEQKRVSGEEKAGMKTRKKNKNEIGERKKAKRKRTWGGNSDEREIEEST